MSKQGPKISNPAQSEAAFYFALADDDPAELYENAPCAYMSTTPDGTIVRVNETFLRWTGYRRPDLIGQRKFQTLLAPGDRIFYETHISPLLRMQGHIREIAVEVVCSSGARLAMLVNSVLKLDAAGEPLFVRIALFDATERRRYEAELLLARRMAQESEGRAATLARILQASFLPHAIVPIPGIDIGGAYRPAGDGTEVGGDFYDVIDTGESTCGVVIGDVCGKGPSAATITSLARYTAVAESVRASTPSDVLEAMHEALKRYHPDKLCAASFLTLATGPDGVRANIASAGSELALILRPGGVETFGEPGHLLGMFGPHRVTETATLLEPGDVMLLFTDGITEARHHGELFGEARLRALLTELGGLGSQEIADSVVAAAVDFQHGNARDDMAVVVVEPARDAGTAKLPK